MVEGKYLKLLLLNVLVIIHFKASGSAWLPKPRKYKITFSYGQIDYKSEKEQSKRIEVYRRVDESIVSLIAKQKEIYMNREAELNNIDKLQSLSLSTKQKQYQLVSLIYKTEIENIDNLIKERLEILRLLTSYQDKLRAKATIEYGTSDNLSFGVTNSNSKNQFFKSEYTRAETNGSMTEIFMKLKVFQNEQYIVTLQPKFCTEKVSGYRDQTFAEISLLTGKTYKGQYGEVFIEGWLGAGECINYSSNDKRYHHYSISEGYKMPFGLMFTNFTRYYFRKNYGQIYSKTIYNQLSIAKEVDFGVTNQNKLTTQLGYFTDRSAAPKLGRYYNVSGLIFSVWLDI